MAKFILEDMVRDKRERQGKPLSKVGRPVKKLDRVELTRTIRPAKVEKPRFIEPPVFAEPAVAKNRSRLMLWVIALVSIGFCFFALSIFFGKAVVTVNPKVKEVTLNENLNAAKDASGDASFNLISIDGTESQTLQATEEKTVAIAATGTVLLYNNFNASPQSLSADSRLEGSNGKVYKTSDKVVIPGLGADGTPGSASVKVYAAEAGESYNSDPLDFKILGFKGTSKYDKFYGRSKGPLTGGFTGKQPVISEADKIATIAALKTALQNKLLQKATGQVPPGFILFPDAVFLSTTNGNGDPDVSSVYNGDMSATLSLHGTLYGILFDENKLTKKIAADTLKDPAGTDVFIANLRDLTFTLADKDTVSFADVTNINFNLSGPAKIVYRLDTDKFINDLLGKPKSEFGSILSQYPSIDSANLSLTPIWKMSLPDEKKDIKVILTLEPGSSILTR